MKNLKKLFSPKSIAVVGASSNRKKLGNVLVRNILDGGWKGKLYYVNPKHKKIGAGKCHTSLGEIKKPVDLALVAIPAPFVSQAIEEGAASSPKISNYVVISAGFKETGEKGKKLEEELEKLAEKHRLNVLGPNCLGFINPYENLNTTFTSLAEHPLRRIGASESKRAGGVFKKGKVAIVSQSGALAVALLDWIENMSVGFSKVISIGNKAALSECDAMSFLSGDKDTKAIALYLEDIKDGRRFSEIAAKTSLKKPIIVLKAGKNKAGQKAISSHTGSLAQDEAVVEAAFEKLNVIEAKTIEEFQDLVLYLDSDKIPLDKKIIILTNAGGPGVLASDFIGKSKRLFLEEINPATKNVLRRYLPESASVENPIDIIGDAAPDRYEAVLEILSKNHSKNPVLVILTPQTQTDPERVAKIIQGKKKRFPVLVTSFMGGEKIKRAVEYLHENGIANFESPERSLAIFEKMVCFAVRKGKFMPPVSEKQIRLKLKANLIIQKAVSKKRKMLFWNEAEKIFKNYGISLAKSISFGFPLKAVFSKVWYPCVLKTDDPKIIHRWDKKAVALGIKNKKELKTAYQGIKKSTGAKNFIIQPMAEPGLEMIIGLKRDESFGPVIVVGWGGTMTEIFKDRVILVPPLAPREIKSKLEKLKIYQILSGYRGERGYKMNEIAEIVIALQNLASENPDVSQIDINPVILYNNDSKYQILDAKVYLA